VARRRRFYRLDGSYALVTPEEWERRSKLQAAAVARSGRVLWTGSRGRPVAFEPDAPELSKRRKLRSTAKAREERRRVTGSPAPPPPKPPAPPEDEYLGQWRIGEAEDMAPLIAYIVDVGHDILSRARVPIMIRLDVDFEDVDGTVLARRSYPLGVASGRARDFDAHALDGLWRGYTDLREQADWRGDLLFDLGTAGPTGIGDLVRQYTGADPLTRPELPDSDLGAPVPSDELVLDVWIRVVPA